MTWSVPWTNLGHYKEKHDTRLVRFARPQLGWWRGWGFAKQACIGEPHFKATEDLWPCVAHFGQACCGFDAPLNPDGRGGVAIAWRLWSPCITCPSDQPKLEACQEGESNKKLNGQSTRPRANP